MSALKLSAIMLGRRNPKSFASATQLWVKVQNSSRSHATAANNTETTKEWAKARPLEEMPSPGIFESIRAHMPGGKYRNKSLSEMMLLMNEEYGDVIYIPGMFGKSPMVISFDPEDFEIVYRNEGAWPMRIGAETMNYYRSKHRADFFKGVEGLMTTQGERWGKFRSAVNPVLMQPKNVRLYLPKMSQVNREFVDRIRIIRDAVTHEMPGDFERVINRWALESVCIVALDKKLDLLRDENVDPIVEKFFKGVTDFVTLSGELDTKPSIWRLVSTPKFKRLMRTFDDILEISSSYIQEAMQRLEVEERRAVEKTEREKSVLEKLLKIDPQIAIVMAMDMLIAGVDTTSGTLAGVMLCLAKTPEKQQKLRNEVRRILPHKDSEFSEASLNDMTYLRACIKESLRIYPLVAGHARMVQRDTVIGGYKVPKGTNVAMCTMQIGNDEKYYPNPTEFLPERWLRTTKDGETRNCPVSLKSNNPFVYLPFGFGPRSCIGRRIAELELELGIARIVRNFNIAYNYPTEKAFKTILFNVPNIPLKFQLTEVDE